MQDLRVEVSGQFQASSYNVGVVCWEPLVEPWSPTLTASLRQAPNGTISVRVDIECDQVRGDSCSFGDVVRDELLRPGKIHIWCRRASLWGREYALER